MPETAAGCADLRSNEMSPAPKSRPRQIPHVANKAAHAVAAAPKLRPPPAAAVEVPVTAVAVPAALDAVV